MHQPIQALEHPKFWKMMDMAARTTHGVKHLSQKETRQRIIQLFKTQMKALSAHHYPTWSDWAHDILAVMVSSVSSEWAFSIAGITISKRRNRLKGNIVEALQCMKCLIHCDLIYREVVVATELEEELESEDIVDTDKNYTDTVKEADVFSWDQVLEDDVDDGNDFTETL